MSAILSLKRESLSPRHAAVCVNDCLSLHQLSESLGNAVDARDCQTHNHSQHVAVVGHLLALSLGFTARQADVIHIAGHLHDIGKIGVPDAILKKQSPLSEEEWHLIRKHPEAGATIVRPVKAFTSLGISEMILHHHERFDGSGYPTGLSGNAIPLGARIIAVADTLSALIQDRPYREGCSFETAVEEIVRHAGSQFDPAVVKVFAANQHKIRSWLEGM